MRASNLLCAAVVTVLGASAIGGCTEKDDTSEPAAPSATEAPAATETTDAAPSATPSEEPTPEADPTVPAPTTTPVDLASLPMWSSPVGGAPATAVGFELHAADADWEWLRIVLADPAKPHIATVGKAQRATGRMAAGRRAELFAALDTAGFQRMPATTLRGKAAAVALSSARASAHGLVWHLAEQTDLNIAVAPDPAAPQVTLMVPGSPADAVLGAVTTAAAWNSFRTGGITFIGPATMTSPDQRLRRTKGPTVDLTLRGARASEALALINRITPVPFGVPCDGGPALRLSLRGVSVAAALGAIQVASGLELAPRAGKDPCKVVAADAVTADATLRGTVTSAKGNAALLHTADGLPAIVTATDTAANVTAIEHGVVTRSTGGALSLAPAPDLQSTSWTDAPLNRARLSATLITTTGAVALVELEDGAHRIIAANATGSHTATIEPGHLVLAHDGNVVADLRLAKRAQTK